jgi:hypothetical protein
MNPEPRQREDYSGRQVEAAHRVLIDLGQVTEGGRDRLFEGASRCVNRTGCRSAIRVVYGQ